MEEIKCCVLQLADIDILFKTSFLPIVPIAKQLLPYV